MYRMDFTKNASNVYRTRNYIVKQIIALEQHSKLDNTIRSQDTFYTRTTERDNLYNKIFADKIDKNGRRLHTSTYTRKYVK